MRTIIALGGRPGSGKTTIMRAILARNQSNMTNPIPGLACHHIVALNTKILGNYSNDHLFGGTDRLSMSIQPAAQTFVNDADCNILFEGDRLFNQSFLRFCMSIENAQVNAIYLDVRDELLIQRYAERGSNQSETFLRSRKTKYKNILLQIPQIHIMSNNTPAQRDKIINTICELIRP